MAFKHILVAVDFAHSSDRALDLAVRMAIEAEAQLTLVNANPVSPMALEGSAQSATDLVTPLQDAMRVQMEQLVGEVKARWARVDGYVRFEDPIQGVLLTAREASADLIVVGTHARHGMERLLLGSIAEGILRDSPLPVLVVRTHPA